MDIKDIDVFVASEEHLPYAPTICQAIETAAYARGTGIAKRKPEYIENKMINIQLVGIGTNVGCYGSISPTVEKLEELVEIAEKIEERLGRQLEYISGGATSSLMRVWDKNIPKRINMLRVGEGILLARDLDVFYGYDMSDLYQDIFRLKAEVIEVKENGLPTVLAQKVKFYARIPDEYLNSQNLVVEGLGNLAGVTDFTREGDFITFYADSSGEIVFYTNDFPYWVIIAIGAVVIIILGIVIILIAAPMRRRKHVNAGARKIYKWSENRGSLEESYMRELKAQREAKKRKWRL